MQVIGLFRHGIRFPGKKDIINVGNILTEFRRLNVNQTVLNKLQLVADAMPMSKAVRLAPSGEQEHQDLGSRFGRRFSNLFSDVAENDIHFVTSSSERAITSGLSFHRGFQAIFSRNSSFLPEQRDDLLRFFEHCPRYMKEVRKNESALFEFYDFCSAIAESCLRQIAKELDLAKLELNHSKKNCV